MRRNFTLTIALLFFSQTVLAQITNKDFAVQLTAIAQLSPPKITLSWKPVTNATSYIVYKKAKSASSWGSQLTSTSATSYVDNAVIVDSAYEYKVVLPGDTQAGYIYAGVKNPAIHYRGSLLLLVDSTFSDSCAGEIKQLMVDISRDGWEVMRKDFLRTETVVNIKSYITTQYQNNPKLNALFIVGHLAIPYSGDINPDGHPNHKGAWPADAFYGDMNGTWTDVSVNNTTADSNKNKNIPADGKYDQSLIPTPLELQVSRIDFANMPQFAKTEIQLMKSYLAKDHQYKTNQLSIVKRGLIDDNFFYSSYGPEAFAANGWRNFPPLVGKDSIVTLYDLITTLNTTSYQWAYGCGGGTYTSGAGLGTTTNFAQNNMNTVFLMMFGSYFGDWNTQNNFLRAPLCSNIPALTICWAGRPNWFFHHMALGEHIGYSALLSQNNDYFNPLYIPSGYGASFVHTALLGDLTLRMDYMDPMSGVTLHSTPTAGAIVSWTPSSDPNTIGYYVYRSNTEFGEYQKCSPLVTGITYTDSAGINGMKYYMVRAAKLQLTPSGVYTNLSLGSIDSGNVTYPIQVKQVKGTYASISVYPNPVIDELHVDIETQFAGSSEIAVASIEGKRILSDKVELHKGANTVAFDVKALPAGLYLLSIHSKEGVMTRKWIKTN